MYRFGEFELDENAGLLTRNGQPVEARRQILELAHYMIRAQGRVVGRDQILQDLWGDVSVSDGTLTNAVYELRVALEDRAKPPRILETVHGRGFRWILAAEQVEATADVGSVFVGREELLEKLCVAHDRAETEASRIVLLSGEAGVGKTATVARFCERIVGSRIWRGRAQAGLGAPPFWPWIEIVRQLLARHNVESLGEQTETGLAALAHWVPELRTASARREPRPAVGEDEARFRIFDAITQVVQNATDDATTVLVIEDLHDADPGSIRLLEHLAERLPPKGLLVLLTCREEQLDQGGVLGSVIGTLTGRTSFERMPLRRLDSLECAALVEAVGGSALEAELARSIGQRSGGNPLFVRELIRLTLEGRSHLEIPDAVDELIRRQLTHFSQTARQLLAAAAVAGTEFHRALLERAAGLDPAQLTESLNEVCVSRFLERTGNAWGIYRFRHPLLREAIYEQLPREARATLHRRVSAALEPTEHASPLAACARLGHEALAAAAEDDVEAIVETSRRAAGESSQAFAYEDAVTHYARALTALESTLEGASLRHAELLLAYGRAQAGAGAVDAGRESIAGAIAIARDVAAQGLFAQAALEFAAEGSAIFEPKHGPKEFEFAHRSVAFLEEALEGAGGLEDGIQIRIHSRLASALYRAGRYEEAIASNQRALDEAETLDQPDVLAEVLRVQRQVLWGRQFAPQRLETADRILALSLQLEDRALEFVARLWRALDYLELADIGTVRREVVRCEALAERLRQPRFQHVVFLLRGTLAALDGRYAEAETLANEAAAVSTTLHPAVKLVHFAQLVAIFRELGRLDEVEPAIAFAVGGAPELHVVHGMYAHILANLGRLEEARAILDRIAGIGFDRIPVDPTWLTSLSLFAGIAKEVCAVEYAPQLFELLLPHAGRNIVVADGFCSTGSASFYLGLLAGLMKRWDEAEGLLRDAQTTTTLLGAQPYGARVLEARAWLCLERGDPRDQTRAIALLDEARTTAQAFGMNGLLPRLNALQTRAQGD